jgi:hypothetical protein
MLKRTVFALTLATLAATAAQAQPIDPLHPSFYRSKYAAPAAKIADSEATFYVDAGNPLSPSFGRSRSADWMTTADRASVPYVDTRNPLSPSFQR